LLSHWAEIIFLPCLFPEVCCFLIGPFPFESKLEIFFFFFFFLLTDTFKALALLKCSLLSETQRA
jgi:hypothetical protein